MNRRLTETDARAWRARWQALEEREVAELRATPPELKLRQLAVLMASIDHFGWRAALDADEELVRERWIRLKRKYSA